VASTTGGSALGTPRTRHWGRVVAVGLVLALLVGGASTLLNARVALAAPVQVDTTGYLNETAVSPFTFVTREYEDLPTKTTIAVSFFNGDTTGAVHSFTILNDSNQTIPTSTTPAQLNALLARYGTLVNVTVSTEGTYNNTTFVSPATGYYEFVCIEPGHFGYGMYGYIAFGEPLPAGLVLSSGSPGPGLAVFIIVGTIVSLTVLALVLGFVVGRRRGSENEMPPERLGYAEPSTSEPLPAAPPPPPGRP